MSANESSWPLSDAHCHDDDAGVLTAAQRRLNVAAIVNCATPAEWVRNQARVGASQHLSFGVHPWGSADFDEAALRPYFALAPVIGEIGLDSVWTKVPQAVQRPVFEAQLRLAAQLQKPVILHTKGEEAACLALVNRYPNRYFVHWYSRTDWQADYIAAGCYMSIGVDVLTDPAVQALAKAVPADRLLLETDGLESVAWAWQRPVTIDEYASVLRRLTTAVATLRETSPVSVATQARANLTRFLRPAAG